VSREPAPGARIGYLGLGSNLGRRRDHLQAAVRALPRPEVDVLASSSVYETEPVGEVLDQRDFLNACLQIRTRLGPEELLDACKAVERQVGRQASRQRYGPREIDVDVLALSDLKHSSQRLRLPHPQLLNRRFVLAPLLELEPALTVGGVSAAAALHALGEGGRVRRIGPPLEV
jgi:2-amino-4-hydroxy-6-hydroxymethyldihydropteridine diphosphokinase